MLENSLSDFRKKITTIFILIISVIYITFSFVTVKLNAGPTQAYGGCIRTIIRCCTLTSLMKIHLHCKHYIFWALTKYLPPTFISHMICDNIQNQLTNVY